MDTINIALKDVDGNSLASYNLFWNNGIDYQNINVENSVFADRLLDTNFIIQNGSPAIDAGTAVSEVTTDFEGTSRPQPLGGEYDIGAHEYR